MKIYNNNDNNDNNNNNNNNNNDKNKTAGALWVSSAGPVVMKRLLKEDGLRRWM